MVNSVQFAAALTVGIVWRLFDDARKLYRALRSKHEGKVQPDVIIKRKAICPGCRLYFAPLATCDSPFYYRRWPNGQPEGCLCHIPTKAQTEGNCPLYDKTHGQEGWPKELNSVQRW